MDQERRRAGTGQRVSGAAGIDQHPPGPERDRATDDAVPKPAFDELEIERYNDLTVQEYVDIRDFLILHYNATERDDSDFWDYCRDTEPPRRPSYKIDMFRRNGRVLREHDELFTETSWLAVMVGQGVERGDYHPAADMLPEAETLERLAHIREVVANTAAMLPRQREYLQQQGSASNQVLHAS